MRTRTPLRLFCQKARLLSGLALAVLLSGQASAGRMNDDLRITPADGARDDRFGTSISMSNGVAIISAINDDDNGVDSGSVYLYHSATGRKIRKLTASDTQGSKRFGSSVAINGTSVIVGASGEDRNGADWGSNHGSAYLFDSTTGNQRHKLIPLDGNSEDYFGNSVAVGNGIALVGAPGKDDRGSSSGAVYLFNASTGSQIDKILPSDIGFSSEFGMSAAINGNRAIIGSVGAAYIYDTSSGTQLNKFTSSSGNAYDNFGKTVAIDDQYALVGALGDRENGSWSGAAYLFDLDTGAELFKLVADDGQASDYFGSSLAISDGLALIGAYNEDDRGDNAGAAYLFDLSTGEQLAKLLARDGSAGDMLGSALALDGGKAILGAWRDNRNGTYSGSAYLFTVAEVPEPTTAMLVLVGVSLLLGGSSRRRVR